MGLNRSLLRQQFPDYISDLNKLMFAVYLCYIPACRCTGFVYCEINWDRNCIFNLLLGLCTLCCVNCSDCAVM